MLPLTPSEWKKWRRRLDVFLFSFLAFTGYIIYLDSSSSVHETALTFLIPSMVALLGSYIFGAAWDDRNYMENVVKMNKKDVSYDYDLKDYPR
jgi:hypothetical protein